MGIEKVAPGMSEFLHIHVSVSSLVLYEKPQSYSQVTVIKRISFLLVTSKLLSFNKFSKDDLQVYLSENLMYYLVQLSLANELSLV